MDAVTVDQIRLNFSPQSLVALNGAIGLMMLGVALDLKLADFKRIITSPKAPAIGLGAQFILLSPRDVFTTIFVILGIPLCAGLLLSRIFPSLADKVRKPFRVISFLIFVTFVALALKANWEIFLHVIGLVVFVVFAHNGLALCLGYFSGRLFGLEGRDVRAVAIEVGIQNSALGLVLIFNFFAGLGGMAIIAAWWGIWHIISGLSVATFWSRRPPNVQQKG
jgi:BASS family bile acid:Na+ symporter